MTMTKLGAYTVIPMPPDRLISRCRAACLPIKEPSVCFSSGLIYKPGSTKKATKLPQNALFGLTTSNGDMSNRRQVWTCSGLTDNSSPVAVTHAALQDAVTLCTLVTICTPPWFQDRNALESV